MLTDIPAWMDRRTGSGNEVAPVRSSGRRDDELATARECRKLLDKAKRKRSQAAKRRRKAREHTTTLGAWPSGMGRSI